MTAGPWRKDRQRRMGPPRSLMGRHNRCRKGSFAVRWAAHISREYHRQVISGHFAVQSRCPVYPRKRTYAVQRAMSAKCQERTSPINKMELICLPICFRFERRCFILKMKSHKSQSEYTMNIFYIIGVVVVVLFIAGYLGLR